MYEAEWGRHEDLRLFILSLFLLALSLSQPHCHSWYRQDEATLAAQEQELAKALMTEIEEEWSKVSDAYMSRANLCL